MIEELIAIPAEEYERLKRIEQAFMDMLEIQKQATMNNINNQMAQTMANTLVQPLHDKIQQFPFKL